MNRVPAVCRIGSERRALTLVEITAGLGIFTVIMAAVFFLFSVSSRYSENINARLELQQALLSASSMITGDLMETGPLVLYNLPADGNAYPSVSFRKAAAPVFGNKAWSPANTSYSLGGANNDRLIRTEAGNNTVVCENVTGFRLRRNASEPDIIEVWIEVGTNTSQGLVSEQRQFSVKMRN